MAWTPSASEQRDDQEDGEESTRYRHWVQRQRGFLLQSLQNGKDAPLLSPTQRRATPITTRGTHTHRPMWIHERNRTRWVQVFSTVEKRSGFRYVQFIVHKSEVFEKLAILETIQTTTGKRVKTFRLDNGLEFIDKEVDAMLQKKGIPHEKSAPYIPQQNGRIERDNWTIEESARSMLWASGLSPSLWTDAVRNAVYILNRSPSSSNSATTSFEQWFNRKPDLSHLRTFGSRAYIHLPKETGRTKWDAKAWSVFLVGHEQTAKNYRFYDPFAKRKKITISCDVQINKEKTPEQLQLPQTTSVVFQ